MFKDPAVLFTNVYTALIYGIYYSFFEVFPLVHGPLYGFNIGETGVVFTCIVVGCVLAIGIYFYYLQSMLIPDILKKTVSARRSLDCDQHGSLSGALSLSPLTCSSSPVSSARRRLFFPAHIDLVTAIQIWNLLLATFGNGRSDQTGRRVPISTRAIKGVGFLEWLDTRHVDGFTRMESGILPRYVSVSVSMAVLEFSRLVSDF